MSLFFLIQVDENCVVRAVELTRQLCLRSKSMAQYVKQELVPIRGLTGAALSRSTKDENEARKQTLKDNDEEDVLSRQNILTQAKRIAESIYHPVGTCKMGNFRKTSIDNYGEKLENFTKPWMTSHEDRHLGDTYNCIEFSTTSAEVSSWEEWQCVSLSKGCPCTYETPPLLNFRGFCPDTLVEHLWSWW